MFSCWHYHPIFLIYYYYCRHLNFRFYLLLFYSFLTSLSSSRPVLLLSLWRLIEFESLGGSSVVTIDFFSKKLRISEYERENHGYHTSMMTNVNIPITVSEDTYFRPWNDRLLILQVVDLITSVHRACIYCLVLRFSFWFISILSKKFSSSDNFVSYSFPSTTSSLPELLFTFSIYELTFSKP